MQVADLQQSLQAAQEEARQAQGDRDALQAKYVTCEQNEQAAQVFLVQKRSEVATLQESMQTTANALAEAQEKEQQLNGELENARVALDQWEAAYQSMQAERDAGLQHVAELEARCQQLQEENEAHLNVMAAKQAAKAGADEELDKTNKSLRDEVDELHGRIAGLQQANSQLQQSYEEAVKQAHAHAPPQHAPTSGSSGGEEPVDMSAEAVEGLQDDNAFLNEQLQIHNKERVDLLAHKAETEWQLKETQKALAASEARLAELDAVVAERLGPAEQVLMERNQLQQQLHEAQESLLQVNARCNELAQVEAHCQALQEENAAHLRTLAAKQQREGELADQLHDLQEQREQAAGALESERNRATQLQSAHKVQLERVTHQLAEAHGVAVQSVTPHSVEGEELDARRVIEEDARDRRQVFKQAGAVLAQCVGVESADKGLKEQLQRMQREVKRLRSKARATSNDQNEMSTSGMNVKELMEGQAGSPDGASDGALTPVISPTTAPTATPQPLYLGQEDGAETEQPLATSWVNNTMETVYHELPDETEEDARNAAWLEQLGQETAGLRDVFLQNHNKLDCLHVVLGRMDGLVNHIGRLCESVRAHMTSNSILLQEKDRVYDLVRQMESHRMQVERRKKMLDANAMDGAALVEEVSELRQENTSLSMQLTEYGTLLWAASQQSERPVEMVQKLRDHILQITQIAEEGRLHTEVISMLVSVGCSSAKQLLQKVENLITLNGITLPQSPVPLTKRSSMDDLTGSGSFPAPAVQSLEQLDFTPSMALEPTMPYVKPISEPTTPEGGEVAWVAGEVKMLWGGISRLWGR
eukprot:NODE_203_length_2951_cov_87.461810_g188_i0.p1 GENE.NODE_203_length_2951_cov_87.461810_g188_i0~~NODE_203_length_2951_cov_87.461810_g188_i0.p1  ORF type:complete len:819 (+),score=220.01 NODE_203_length_2951_cov_87.461810_g188_i0:230-2686(+)